MKQVVDVEEPEEPFEGARVLVTRSEGPKLYANVLGKAKNNVYYVRYDNTNIRDEAVGRGNLEVSISYVVALCSILRWCWCTIRVCISLQVEK